MRKELLPYAGLVSFLEEILGDDYAAALYDLDDLTAPAAATANFDANISRFTGQSADVKSLVKSAAALPFDYLCGFQGLKERIAKDKLAVFFIQDEEGHRTGALVFLRLYSEKADIREVVGSVLRIESSGEGHADTAGSGEPAERANALDAKVDEILLETIGEIYAPYSGKKLRKADKIAMMRRFFETGITKMRGGMAMIAEVTGISQASLYRYLLEILEE